MSTNPVDVLCLHSPFPLGYSKNRGHQMRNCATVGKGLSCTNFLYLWMCSF
jgi:hypothetical protein